MRKVFAVVADAPQFAAYWARDCIGAERKAVEIAYEGRVFYIDDERGQGWDKVMRGGLPRMGHKNLEVSDVRPRE